MGNQINFYMSKHVQDSFIEYLEQNQFVFLDDDSKILFRSNSKIIFDLYLYKKDYGNIIMRQDNKEIMDSIKSPVIQYNKSVIDERQKKILRGRLWISNKYYNDDGKLIKKNEMFLKDYQMLTRWIKKHVPYQKIKKNEFFFNEYVNDELIELQEKGFVFTMSL